MRASGFDAEADKAEQGGGGEALSDRLLDAICLIGPPARCRDRLAEYREAGLDLPDFVARTRHRKRPIGDRRVPAVAELAEK